MKGSVMPVEDFPRVFLRQRPRKPAASSPFEPVTSVPSIQPRVAGQDAGQEVEVSQPDTVLSSVPAMESATNAAPVEG
jgi:hypothetical protein